jgi:hypothetical protein
MPEVTVDYKKAFSNAGLDFSKVLDKGVQVKMSTAGMKFHMDGEVLASLPFAPGKVADLANHFDPKSQAHLSMKASLQQVLTTLEGKLLSGAPTGAKPFGSTATTKAGSASTAAPVAPQIVYGGVDTFPPDQMKTATAVKLATATQLFQPVGSTSAGSRYYVVGVGEGVMVAARLKGTKLSVRVEGTAFAKLSQKIQEAGVFGPKFAGSFEGDYASMHLAVEGKKEAARVIGAVLASLAPYIKHPTPDLEPLVLAA